MVSVAPLQDGWSEDERTKIVESALVFLQSKDQNLQNRHFQTDKRRESTIQILPEMIKAKWGMLLHGEGNVGRHYKRVVKQESKESEIASCRTVAHSKLEVRLQ